MIGKACLILSFYAAISLAVFTYDSKIFNILYRTVVTIGLIFYIASVFEDYNITLP